MALGCESEITRFMEEFNAFNLSEHFGISFMNDIGMTCPSKGCCMAFYDTRNGPFINGLLEFLKGFPSIKIRLSYSEYLGGFQGYLNYKKGAVRYFKEERIKSLTNPQKPKWSWLLRR